MLINEKNKSIAALFISALFFGSTFLIVKNLLDTFSPTFVVFLRYIIAAFIFGLIGGIPNKIAWNDKSTLFSRKRVKNGRLFFRSDWRNLSQTDEYPL